MQDGAYWPEPQAGTVRRITHNAEPSRLQAMPRMAAAVEFA